MNNFWQSFVQFFTSLKLTVALLALSLIMIFFATLDQKDLGVWGIQQKWFHSFIVLQDVKGLPVPIFPGGYFLGGLLLINLVSSHLYRFRMAWKKSGIFLTHFGLILLLIGELLSGVLQQDNQVALMNHESKKYSESQKYNELAIIDTSDPKVDQVVAIPEELLKKKASFQNPNLPFRVTVKDYYDNSFVQSRDLVPSAPPSPATTGFGPQQVAMPIPLTYKSDERNVPAAYVELTGADNASLGTFLVTEEFKAADTQFYEYPNQTFTYEGKTYSVALRPERSYVPYSITLEQITNDIYPGSDIPKNFSSRVHIKSDDGRDDREVLIYMNSPLRFRGLTYYQYQMDSANNRTVLQAVRNPSWLLPYVSCVLMGLGLVIQFGIHLFGFVRKRTANPRAVVA